MDSANGDIFTNIKKEKFSNTILLLFAIAVFSPSKIQGTIVGHILWVETVATSKLLESLYSHIKGNSLL